MSTLTSKGYAQLRINRSHQWDVMQPLAVVEVVVMVGTGRLSWCTQTGCMGLCGGAAMPASLALEIGGVSHECRTAHHRHAQLRIIHV